MSTRTRSDLAGKTVTVVTARPLPGQPGTTVEYRIEDWWTNVGGQSWMTAQGNRACLGYAIRAGLAGLPLDDEVLYGKTPDGLGHLVHISEIHDEVPS